MTIYKIVWLTDDELAAYAQKYVGVFTGNASNWMVEYEVGRIGNTLYCYKPRIVSPTDSYDRAMGVLK